MMVGNNIVGFSKKLYPVEISFHNLRLELPNGVVPLADVSGTFQHSHITAIMGNSGSGKSTLVKTLLGFSHQGKVSGVTTINGKPARLERIKKVSAFVQQVRLCRYRFKN
jgi:ABC-type transport system involved in cytochrome bd biosynthesis fused ATPase/permease subunit